MYIVIDPGSTHMGQKHLVKEIISKARDCGVNAVKFQLFPDDMMYTSCGNVHMPFHLFEYAYKVGKLSRVDVTASVFGNKEAEFLTQFKIPFVKFAYSKREDLDSIKAWLKRGVKTVVTTDVMHVDQLPFDKNLVKLWTATVDGKTLYPCHFEVDFEGLFEKFDGFSDHTLGIGQAQRAKEYGCKWIEKHAGPVYNDVTCPDKSFCLDWEHLDKFVKAVK